ncbi:MAG: sugar transferase [Treponema sp.]|nr:sugar transferase [Treponema sp.]
MNYAPVVLFCYNRPEHTYETLVALAKNIYAEQTDVYIFVDGIRDIANEKESFSQKAVIKVVSEIEGFKSKTIYISEKNNGLAKSIITGVTKILSQYKSVIVLEDDIVSGKYFLEYMNTALKKYADNKKVWHITGWHNPTKIENRTDSFFYPLMDCWSWATWEDRWSFFEKNPEKLICSMSSEDIRKFNVDGLVPNKWAQVLGNYNGVNNTWAIFWYAAIMQHDGLCLAPANSLVKNIGFDNTGVHSTSKEDYRILTDINHRISVYPKEFQTNEIQYSIIKKDYRKRFRKERVKAVVSKILPNKVKNFIRKLRKNK